MDSDNRNTWIEDREPRWFALYTRSRHEKMVDSQLHRKGIESYLPLQKVRRRWSDRIKIVEEPLFRGYLFVKTDLYNKQNILQTKGVVNLITFKGIPVPIDENVIDSLKNIIQAEVPIDPFPYIEKGTEVQVVKGPFAGTIGYVLRKDPKKCRLVISIRAIKSSISIEVDREMVETY